MVYITAMAPVWVTAVCGEKKDLRIRETTCLWKRLDCQLAYIGEIMSLIFLFSMEITDF